jgi:hypothetical protein
MKQSEIDNVVRACLEHVKGTNQPAKLAKDFLAALRKAGWSVEALAEAEKRIAEGLASRPEGSNT